MDLEASPEEADTCPDFWESQLSCNTQSITKRFFSHQHSPFFLLALAKGDELGLQSAAAMLQQWLGGISGQDFCNQKGIDTKRFRVPVGISQPAN